MFFQCFFHGHSSGLVRCFRAPYQNANKQMYEHAPPLSHIHVCIQKLPFFAYPSFMAACWFGRWWQQQGREELFQKQFGVEDAWEDLAEASDSEDEGSTSTGPQHPKIDKRDGTCDVEQPNDTREAHAIHTMEVVNNLKDEIVALNERESAPVAVVDDRTKDPASPFSSRDLPEGGEGDVGNLDCTFTVRQILMKANLHSFEGQDDDNEMKCLERIRSLCPGIKQLVTHIRVHERVLSRANILGDDCVGKPGMNSHNYSMHLLARLRAKYSLNCQRQSRFTAWSTFAKQVADEVQQTSDKPVANVIKSFSPSCNVTADGERIYQILVVRLHVCDRARFMLVEEIFRGSADKRKNGHGSKLVAQSLDAAFVKLIRGVLLAPAVEKGEKAKKSGKLFTCTCKSPAVIVKPCDEEGIVLWEVPSSSYCVEETSVSLNLWFDDAAVLALKEAYQKGWAPSNKKEAGLGDAISYTPEAFRHRKNVQAYVTIMKNMLAKRLGLSWLSKGVLK